jgi:YD repeat-containing protein
VSATRSLVTKFCQYDAAGRPARVIAPNGAITAYTYNWRGQPTSITEDEGGLGLVTDLAYL